MTTTTFTVPTDDAGVRFDRILRRSLPHTPLTEIFRLIRTGGARLNGRKARGSVRVREGDTVELAVRATELDPGDRSPDEAIRALSKTGMFERSFRLAFEDDELLVCDKPAGLVVHPGSGHTRRDTLIDMAHAYLVGLPGGRQAPQPYLVHRLDRDTSGLVMVARSRRALRELHQSLREGAVHKTYRAVVHGAPTRERGTINVDMARTHGRNDGTKMVVRKGGRRSRSRYRVVASKRGFSLLEVTLDTGRTHQIRVHLAHLGCPIVGDVRYGDAEADAALFSSPGAPERRLYLHAARLSFPHPLSGDSIAVTSAMPGCFGGLVKAGAAAGRKRRRKRG